MSTSDFWRKNRQQEAVARQKEYDALSTSEKIARAKTRPGNSEKEIGRLTTILEGEKS